MQFAIDSLKLGGLACSITFLGWPLILVAPLQRGRRMLLENMVLAWSLTFGVWVWARAAGAQPLNFVIPEPLNTYLFFLAGAVVIATWLVRKALRRRGLHKSADTARSPQDLLDLSPAQFEEMVVEAYRMRGAKAWRTGATGDHGVDVVVETPKGEKWVVQCKRWRGWVGEPTVRDFYGTLQHEKAHKGVLVTTGTFSNTAHTWAQGKPLSLVDGEQFLKSWKDSRKP